MSRYPPPEYRGPRERSRSPPRFSDRRQSAANIFNPGRGGGPDAPRGPRSQFDDSRPPLRGGFGSSSSLRGGFPSRNEPVRELRDAPPLGSDRGRPFKDRDFDRRERIPSPRERSPPRGFRDPRDYPPRDLDIGRGRRGSRDGPLSASSTYTDAPPFAPGPFRGGGGRGRGRGDFSFRGGRGGRREIDERDLFRRERSPPQPPRWGRDLSRDGREPEPRREERRFDRRDDERRPPWVDREREMDRIGRDQPPPRLEARKSNESVGSGPPSMQQSSAPPINPDRLALLESAGADTSVRRQSVQQPLPAASQQPRREQPEIPAYLDGRAGTTNNRYASRGSSPPTQAPPVPAFTLSFAPPPALSYNGPPSHVWKAQQQPKVAPPVTDKGPSDDVHETLPSALQDASAPKASLPPAAPKAQLASLPPTSAPRAPRALEVEPPSAPAGRLQGVRSWENLAATQPPANQLSPGFRASSAQPPRMPLSPVSSQAQMPSLTRPMSPNHGQAPRSGELVAPTGPRASRASPALSVVSPRPSFASPRSDTGNLPTAAAFPRVQTPPPSAPSGPRNRSYSVSPKVTSSTVPTAPTAPKGSRVPPLAPRGSERGPLPVSRGPERLGAPPPPWAPPTAPRGPQWNQWRRPGVPAFGEKSIPAKRDFAGEEKERQPAVGMTSGPTELHSFEQLTNKVAQPAVAGIANHTYTYQDRMDIDDRSKPTPAPQASGHSAKQSFLGKPVQTTEEDTGASDVAEDTVSSSEDDLEIEDPALFEAKFKKQKRQIEAQMVDLSSREYRATTPLESIARLARMSYKDLERFREREQEMDVDEPPPATDQLMPPVTHSSESDEGTELVTPKGEEHVQVSIQSSDGSAESVRHVRRPSPEVITLPYLLKEPQAPLHESETFRETTARQEETKDAVFAAMQAEARDREDTEEDTADTFAEQYRKWREECEDLDREREEQEKLERQQSLEPGPEPDLQMPPPANPVMEGRRLHKFNSEYEFELVLKQSEETARIEQEKADREAKKNQADMEKEAHVPDMMTAAELCRAAFVDNNRYRDPETLTQVFAYEPPVDNFSEEEQKLFVAAFKETPKKWGEIASLLGPHRTYKDCIHHYYATKWDGRFRDNRARKLKGVRRGRGAKAPPRGKGSALMADLARTEELAPPVTLESGRPKRAAAPTTFGERELDAKAALLGPSPAKKLATSSKQESNGENGAEKPVKRRKGAGDKPGRKGKAQQPLAALAAAPAMSMSPNKQFLQGMHTKEEIARAQSLEDASLLAGLQTGNHNMVSADGQIVYAQETFMPPMTGLEEAERIKAAGTGPSSKPSASSYWSVPEQSDFVKYIGHFGTDFAAIAAHMGTKTQTMIKNHYMRQIDGGNRPDLEEAATIANARRDRGEDMGAPPTPTPIIKRKYDNPQPNAPRALAPHTDAMEIDEVPQMQRVTAPKHVSPPQFQSQPRFTTSAQSTPIPAHRVAPSPVQAAASAATPTATPQVPPAAPPRSVPQPLGPRMGLFSDKRDRPESRPGVPISSTFRMSEQPTPPQNHNQPLQSSRPIRDAHDPQFLQSLIEEQKRAREMQGTYQQQDRADQQMQHRNPFQQPQIHRSPATQALQAPPERKPLAQERAPTPPRNPFQHAGLVGGLFRSPGFGPLAPTPASMLASRPTFNTSPPKKEDPRPSSVPSVPKSQPPATPAPAAEAPKRSNLMSILNSEAEEPKPASKRISSDQTLLQAPQRNASPVPSAFPGTPQGPPPSSMGHSRHETFGQPSMPQSQLRHSSLGQTQMPPSGPPALKQEQSSGSSAGMQQPPKPDWASSVLSRSTQPPPSNAPPAFERDVRPYFSHRSSVLGGLNAPTRANPSPPPHTIMSHSRTPSLTTQGPTQPPREQRPFGPSQQQQQQPQQKQQQAAHPLQANTYAREPPPASFGQQQQQQQPQAPSHAHHSHNTSLGGGFPGIHHQRVFSREDAVRQEQVYFAQRQQQEEQEMRRMAGAREIDRQREQDFLRRNEMAQMARREEDERQRHQQQQQQQQQNPFGRGPPPPMHAHHFGGSGFDQGPRPMLGLREQSMRDAQAATIREEQRRREELDQQQRMREASDREAHFRELADSDQRRRYEEQVRREEELRRRHDEAFAPPNKRTPLGGGYGPPPPRR